MKKLILMFVAITAISFASCGGRVISSVAEEDSTSVDSVAVDTVVSVTGNRLKPLYAKVVER